MRADFTSELELVERRMELLFGEVENAVANAVAALLEFDERRAAETISRDDLIDQLTLSVEEAVVQSIARQSPVARDLRYLLCVHTVAIELERCGDLALRVAKRVFDREWIGRSDDYHLLLARLGDRSLEAIRRAAVAWSDRDPEAYRGIDAVDADADAIFVEIVDRLRHSEGPHAGAIVLNVFAAAQALERIADHAVNIGQRIRYLVSGAQEGLAAELAP